MPLYLVERVDHDGEPVDPRDERDGTQRADHLAASAHGIMPSLSFPRRTDESGSSARPNGWSVRSCCSRHCAPHRATHVIMPCLTLAVRAACEPQGVMSALKAERMMSRSVQSHSRVRYEPSYVSTPPRLLMRYT